MGSQTERLTSLHSLSLNHPRPRDKRQRDPHPQHHPVPALTDHSLPRAAGPVLIPTAPSTLWTRRKFLLYFHPKPTVKAPRVVFFVVFFKHIQSLCRSPGFKSGELERHTSGVQLWSSAVGCSPLPLLAPYRLDRRQRQHTASSLTWPLTHTHTHTEWGEEKPSAAPSLNSQAPTSGDTAQSQGELLQTRPMLIQQHNA